MSSKALVWIRDDFRIINNDALIYATNNHDVVTVVFIFNNHIFDNLILLIISFVFKDESIE